MKITYDSRTFVSLSAVASRESQIPYTPLYPLSRGDLRGMFPLKRGLDNSDYHKDGNIVGLEILDASKRMENPVPLNTPQGINGLE